MPHLCAKYHAIYSFAYVNCTFTSMSADMDVSEQYLLRAVEYALSDCPLAYRAVNFSSHDCKLMIVIRLTECMSELPPALTATDCSKADRGSASPGLAST